MKMSPLCWHLVAGSKACSRTWDKNIFKAHHFLTSPLQHLLPKAVCTDSSIVAATSDLQPHPANMLGAHVLMQTIWGSGKAYGDSLKSMGTAHLFKVCKIWPPVSSYYLSLKHKGAESVYEILQQWKKSTSCGHDYAGIGPCWRPLCGFFFFILKK